MTAAVSQLRSLDTISQVQAFCSSIVSLLSTICERTDLAFRRVYVMKKDEQGNIKLYKDVITGESGKVAVLTYIEDIKTGDMQLDEPAYIIATKCALLVIGIPFYTLGKMAWHVFVTPFEISALVNSTLKKVGQQLVIERFYEATVKMERGFSQIPEMLGNRLLEIVKAPIFGLGAELVSIYGIFKPYHGRKIEAIIESIWQQGASYKDDFRKVPARAGESCWEAFIKDLQNTHPFYLAHCFQSRGNVNNSRIVVVHREAL